MKIRFMSSGRECEIERLGVLTPKPIVVEELSAGEVGFISAGIKEVSEIRIGETLTDPHRPTAHPFPGFKVIKPTVFCGSFRRRNKITPSFETRWKNSD